MLRLWRPRAAVVVPLFFALCAAALLLLIALSIIVQPADMDARTESRTPDVLRSVFFAAAGLAFFTSLAGFARRRLATASFGDRVDAGDEDVTGFGAPAAGEDEMTYTLVALDGGSGETRAILDYEGPEALLDAITRWRRRHPEEELHVYIAGHEVARRRAVAEPEPALVTPALQRVRPQQRLATGGV